MGRSNGAPSFIDDIRDAIGQHGDEARDYGDTFINRLDRLIAANQAREERRVRRQLFVFDNITAGANAILNLSFGKVPAGSYWILRHILCQYPDTTANRYYFDFALDSRLGVATAAGAPIQDPNTIYSLVSIGASTRVMTNGAIELFVPEQRELYCNVYSAGGLGGYISAMIQIEQYIREPEVPAVPHTGTMGEVIQPDSNPYPVKGPPEAEPFPQYQ